MPTLFDDLPVIIWTIDTEFHITSSQGGGVAALGLKPNQLNGVHLFEYLGTSDPEFPAIIACQQALAGETTSYYLSWQGREYHTRVEPLCGAGGQIVGAIGLSHDITHQKEAEYSIQRSEQKFRDLFNHSPDAIFVEDLEGNVLDANPAACRLHKMGLGELVGKHVSELVPPDYREQLAGNFPKVVAGECTWIESHSWTSDQQSVPVELRVARISFQHRPALLFHVRDITERKRLVEQTTKVEKLEAIGRLAGGIAHDFNNLLTVVLGNCEVLLRSIPQDRTREMVEEVQSAGERAAGLTRQLLAFSRSQIATPELVNLNHVVKVLERTVRRVLADGVRFQTDLADDLDWVLADPVQLEQVILNLAFNARDAMPLGGQFTLATNNMELDADAARRHAEAKPGRYVVLAASDSGCGMDEATVARVFDPFFTTKPPGQGIGLGLAMVQGIMRQNGGFIAINSILEKGTRFYLFLPRAMEPESTDSPAAAAPDHKGGETILVAEDQPGVRALAVRFLRQHGFNVLEAISAEEALRISDEYAGTIHLLLTDLTMPGSSGRVLAERLVARRPETKVIVMSGHLGDIALLRGLERPNIVFLQKPFTSASLIQLVRDVLHAGPR